MAELETEVLGAPRVLIDATECLAAVHRSRVLARYRRLAALIAGTDVLSVLAAMTAAYFVKSRLGPVIPGLRDFQFLLAVVPVFTLGIFVLFRLYSIQHMSSAEELRRVVTAVSVGMMAVVTFSYWSRASYSRSWVGMTWLLSILIVLISRVAWARALTRIAIHGALPCAPPLVRT